MGSGLVLGSVTTCFIAPQKHDGVSARTSSTEISADMDTSELIAGGLDEGDALPRSTPESTQILNARMFR